MIAHFQVFQFAAQTKDFNTIRTLGVMLPEIVGRGRNRIITTIYNIGVCEMGNPVLRMKNPA